MLLLARRLDQEKYELHLGVVTQTETTGVEFPDWVRVHTLGASRVRDGAFKLLGLVRRVKPELILSGMFHLNFLVLLLRPFFPRRTCVLVRQNGTVSAMLDSGGLPWSTRLLYRLLYRRADRVICQTNSMANDLARTLGLLENRISVLPNPVDLEEIQNFSGESPVLWPGPGPHLLAVGRLSHEKGFDLLLQALTLIRRQVPGVSLLIAGIGPEEARLKAQCHASGLDTAVRFAGEIARPWTCFPNATLFVLASRHEGMPNALLEAATGGLPIVALPASGGVVDLLRDQPGVWLAPAISAEALAASLLAALLSLRPGERFTHPFIEQFRIGRAIHAYEELIDRTLQENPR
jgi:glycosyltransferase involved in cell wall biosynthesis